MSDNTGVPLWAFALLSGSLTSAIILTRNGCGVCYSIGNGIDWVSYQFSYFMLHPIELLWNPFFWFIIGNIIFYKLGGWRYFQNRMYALNE